MEIWVFLKKDIVILHDLDIKVITKILLFDFVYIPPIRKKRGALHRQVLNKYLFSE